jgi:hypothetical protein
MGALYDRYVGVLGAALPAGEELRGLCMATESKTFSGRSIVLGVTDTRVLLLALNRRGEPAEAPRSLDIAEASAGGLSRGSLDPAAWLIDAAGVKLTLCTTDGERLKLQLLNGGAGSLGRLGGGEDQATGMQALADRLNSHTISP